jgi:hypothetical protein
MQPEIQTPSPPPSTPQPPSFADNNWLWLVGSATALLSIAGRYFYKYIIEPWWERQKLKLVMSISQERSISNALAQILLILRADRCLLLQFDIETKPYPTIICNNEICAPGVSEVAPLVNRSNRCTSRCYEILSKAVGPNYRLINEVENAGYYNFLVSIGVKKLVTLPIKLEDRFLGCIVVHWIESNEAEGWDFRKIEQQFAIVSDTLLNIELAKEQ